MNNFHLPVLLKEAVEGLRVKNGSKYIDATIGGGGHSGEILRRGGIVLGLDVDQEAIEYVENNFKFEILNLKLILARGNFREIDKIPHLKGFGPPAGGADGIIFDLGVSSHQLETDARGFSFQKEGPLDMRMDRQLSVRAKDLINVLSQKQLYEIFTKFGEESLAWPISKRIVRARAIKPIETTRDLTEAIGRGRHGRINMATKIFQALRIAVNDELNALEEALPKALGLLKSNGRLAVISFHSLEDRIVKNEFLEFERNNLGKIITEKPIVAGTEELKANRRARSAKLRIFEKILN